MLMAKNKEMGGKKRLFSSVHLLISWWSINLRGGT